MRHFLALVALSSCFAIWATNAKATVRVEYVHPVNFTDVSFRSMTPEAAEKRLERELTQTIEAAAARYLSAYQLDVQIVDVAMTPFILRNSFCVTGFVICRAD